MTSLMQEMFLIAQNSDDHQLQQYAAWAVSFLRTHLWSKELLNLDVVNKTDMASSKSSQNFADDSEVMKLSSWLMHLNLSGVRLLLQAIPWCLFLLNCFQNRREGCRLVMDVFPFFFFFLVYFLID